MSSLIFKSLIQFKIIGFSFHNHLSQFLIMTEPGRGEERNIGVNFSGEPRLQDGKSISTLSAVT